MIAGVPLFVGVTGHRAIPASDEAAAKAAFGALLRKLGDDYPHTSPVVLSALADGADLLAAEEAIARDVAVIACIPISIDAYERDFDPAALARFRAALAACARVEIVPASDRLAGYVAAGMHVARSSHVLVAFWDGRPSRGPGGTAEVVRARLTGMAQQREGLADIPHVPDIGPVAQIVTARADEPRPAHAFALRWIHPRRFHRDVSAERDFWTALDRLDRYNADLAAHPSHERPRNALDALADRTDAAANALQRRTSGFLMALYAFAFVAAFTQIVFGSEPMKLATLGLAFLAYLFVRRNDFENRYQDYRAIAEGLRVQIAWNDAGLTGETVEPHYLRTQQGELQWIRMALRAACEWYDAGDAPVEEKRAIAWVRGQWRYFYRGARREGRRARRSGLLARVAVGIGAIGAVALTVALLPQVQRAFGWTPASETIAQLKHWSAALAALGATFAALVANYAEKRSFALNARRFDRMFVVFDRARLRINAVLRGGPGSVPAIVGEIGREALVEQADWLLIRRDRPVSFVQS